MDFIIKDRIIKLDKASLAGKKVVSVNSDYIANFIFDAEWDGLTKTVRFINDGDIADIVLINTNSCEIPRIVMKSGTLEVGVFGGDIRSTNVAKLSIVASILEETGPPSPPADDVYSQIIVKLDDILEESRNNNRPLTIDDTLKRSDEGVLGVNTVTEAIRDDTRPITSGGVNVILGNINVLLETI